MNEENRPSPEELLKAIDREEQTKKRGHLKIFLGMCAGVGKTYAMLEAAQKRQSEGLDVLVGTINTHGRQETARLLEGLKLLPEKWINYKDTVFEELDIDEILRLKPQLVIIDELAHSNIPGSRHPKRWQDVVEILDHGIDVYTTLNVQHIESLKDIIENISSIQIRETVPDSILESADNIEIIDLSPTELLLRLKEGKVYLGDQSQVAARNFFKEDRLTALREIVFLFAAEKVDHDLHGMISTIQRRDGWRTRERLMVAVSHSPHSQKLIRMTRRLAFNLDAPWLALHINTGQILDEEDQAMLDKNLALARELGAEVITISDPDIVDAVERMAKQRGITQIIVGRSPKKTIVDLFRGSLIDRLAREITDIDVHVIRQSADIPPYKKRLFKRGAGFQFGPYFLSFCFVMFFTIFNWFLIPYVDYQVIGFIFLISILILSLFLKKGPIIFATILYACIWAYFFIPLHGKYSFTDLALLILYFFTAIITGILIDRARERKEILVKRDASTQAIYDIVRTIAGASTFDNIMLSVKSKLGSILNGKCEIILKKLDNGLNFEQIPTLSKDEKEQNAAKWVFDNAKEAGWSTTTLPSVQYLYIPLKGYNEIFGVLAYRPINPHRTLSTEEFNFTYTVAQQLSNYLERRFSEERVRKEENLSQIEKIYQTVLKLISNQFQYPLISIQESIQELKNEKVLQKSPSLTQIHKIENNSQGLIRNLENISAMAHFSTGMLPIQKEWYDVKELIEVCRDNLKKPLENHKLSIKIQEDLPKIKVNFSLIELLLYNLVFNAIEYSPPNTTIEIEAKTENGDFVLSVADEGKGFPEETKDLIFEKFYRVPGTESAGLGLGLAISKTIADIHNAELKAENRPEGGAKLSFILPVGKY